MDPKKQIADSVWNLVCRASLEKLSGTLEVTTGHGESDVMIFVFPKNSFTRGLEKAMSEQSEIIASVKRFVDPASN